MTRTPNNRELIPTEPSEALQLYIDDLEVDGAAQATIYSHKSRLGHFVRWCNEVSNINNLNNLTGRDIQKYRTSRSTGNGDVTMVI